MSKSKAFIDGIHSVLNGADLVAIQKSERDALKQMEQEIFGTQHNDNATNNEKGEVMSAKTKESKPAAKKEQLSPADLTREQIIACATDMNDKMGLDPAINVKLATQAIVRDIMKNAAELDHTDFDGSKKEDEQIIDATKETLSALGFKVPAPPKVDPPAKKSAPTKPTKPAATSDDKKTDPPATKPAKVKSAKQMRQEREAAKANKAPAAPKYTRTNAFIDAIKKSAKGKGANFDKIMSTVNELYAKHGHDEAATNDNAKKSRLLMVLESLVAFEVLNLKDGVYTLNV